MAARILTCRKCHQKFDANKIQAFKVGNRAYIHYSCRENEDGELVSLPTPKSEKPKSDEQKIKEYAKSKLGKSYNAARINQQIKQFKNEYGYTESGILKTLKYIYDIKKMSTDKANGGIGLVPYLYPEAYQYYLSIFESEQANASVNAISATQKTTEITIKEPKSKYKHRLFHLWEVEEVEENE